MRRIIVPATVVMSVLATAAAATAAVRTVYYCTPQDCSLTTGGARAAARSRLQSEAAADDYR